MLPLTVFPVGIIVLALAACGMPSGPAGQSTAEIPALRCSLGLTERGGQLQIEGQLQATATVTGRYALSILQSGRAGQNMISQSGDFSARAGETVTLGSASVTGSAAAYDATLTVDYADTTIRCPVTLTN